MKMKLYEIAEQYRVALDMLSDPEKFDQLKDTLDFLDENLKDKADAVLKHRQNLLADAAALKAEEKRLKARREQIEREAEGSAKLIDYIMRKNSFKKLEAGSFKVSYRKSTSLEVIDVNEVPEHFLKPQPPKVDVAGMKKHIKQIYDDRGMEIPEDLSDLGVKFVQKENLQINDGT
jgi:hypothetical protein